MTDETPTTGPEKSVPPTSKAVTTVTAGTLIMGTYEIERLINSGGMGEVYRGRNIHNDEPVAIKIVLPSLAHDPKIVALFQKESTVLSRLAHEAIVRYHVFTNDPTIGRPCMVMEFVSGTALSDRIEQGPIPLDDVKIMLRRVASGLDKAHRAGVVHRDLSPDNIILEEGAVEHAKLIDFGIAKSTNFGSGTLLQGQFAGKFNWVSPEQLGAYGGVVDGRSDIYSLGLIIAGACRGAVLQMGASIVDAVSKRASVPELEGVYPELQPLLGWMLEPDPANRVESMAKVIQALDNPAQIPGREPVAPAAPDPNRTVIEPLPAQTSAPKTLDPPKAPEVSTPPAGWDVPVRETSVPPDGATVIAAQPLTGGPLPLAEPEDVSPFGAPEAKVKPVSYPELPKVAEPSKGKGGMIGVLAALAVAAGGAGVYFSGVLDSKDPGTTPAKEEQKAEVTPEKPADEGQKAEDQAKADEAAKAAEAAAKAAEAEAAAKAEAEAKAAADAEAAKAKEEEAKAAEAEAAAKDAAKEARSQGEAIAAARAMADAALKEVEAVGAEVATAKPDAVAALTEKAKAAAAKAKAAADAANAGLQAATKAGLSANQVPTAAEGLDEVLAKAGTEAKAAADSASAAEAASAKVAEAAQAITEAEAQRLAEAKAKEEALKADPVARQQAFFDTLSPAPCVHLRLVEAKAEGFALEGFAVETKPLEEITTAWTAATEKTPDIAVHLINEEQCAALDFMNAHKSSPLTLQLTNAGEAVKSGTSVEGVIKGLPNQNFALLVISGAGAATNLKDFVTAGDDGSASFKFALKLVEGQPPAPHVLLAVTADEALVAMLTKLKPGTSIGGDRGLLPFMDKQLASAGLSPQVGLGFFKLEN